MLELIDTIAANVAGLLKLLCQLGPCAIEEPVSRALAFVALVACGLAGLMLYGLRMQVRERKKERQDREIDRRRGLGS